MSMSEADKRWSWGALNIANLDLDTLASIIDQQVDPLVDALERAVTLLDATARFIRQNPIQEYTVFYDEAQCDGGCLADDCRISLEESRTALRIWRGE